MNVKPTAEGVRLARDVVRQHAAPTPLVHAPLLSERLACDLWIKNETVSPIASFKWRGALAAIAAQRDDRGVVTASTGNHGQGVAWAAQRLGVPARVYLPTATPNLKRRKIASFGAVIESVDGDLDAARQAAVAFGESNNVPFIDDGEDPAVIEGAGTVGLEVAEGLPHIDRLYVPMGSGSLASGIAIAVKASQPGARVIAVQSAGSPSMVDSFHARRRIARGIETIAEGLQCGIPAELALEMLVERVDDAILVSDRDLLDAMRLFMADAQLLVEPSGAAGLAGALAHRGELAGVRVVVIATGANVVLDTVRMALDHH